MSTFVCPECGHESEYDEWADSARCPNCGFEPPSGTDKDLQQQGDSNPQSTAESKNTGLTRFLPASGRAFISGLAWGIFAFALIMLISSWLDLSGSMARCVGIAIPVLVTFAVWRFFSAQVSD